jgi:hypothetical protein
MDYHRGAGVEVKLHLLDRGLNVTTDYPAKNKMHRTHQCVLIIYVKEIML